MSSVEIEPWADLAETTGPSAILIQAAQDWHRLGIDSRSAIAWFNMDGWTPENALPWYRGGFTPREAEISDGLIFYAEMQQAPGSPQPSSVNEWLQCGIPASWVCRALLLGLHTTDQAREFYELNAEDNHLAGTVDLIRDVYAVGLPIA